MTARIQDSIPHLQLNVGEANYRISLNSSQYTHLYVHLNRLEIEPCHITVATGRAGPFDV